MIIEFIVKRKKLLFDGFVVFGMDNCLMIIWRILEELSFYCLMPGGNKKITHI